jgi:sporulation protein YlmC with PRC-barrel domain
LPALHHALFAACFAVAVVGALHARGQPSALHKPEGRELAARALQHFDGSLVPAKNLIDAEVLGRDGRTVGEVEDIIVDPGLGRVVGFVVEINVPRSRKDRYIALPPDRLAMTPDGTFLETDLSPEEAAALPRFAYRR